MRRSMKTRLTAFLALCLCACICLAFPVNASADVTLEKLLVAMPTTPIAYMPAGNISASSSTEGCSVQSLVWYDASGSQFSGTFGTQTYTVEIVVSLAEGYSLASDARVYLNNSAVDYTVSGSSVTLRREYAPQIWTPDIYKHPEAETVTEGGFASFAASGAYYEKINWRLYNPDATSYYTMEEAVEKFPGLTTDADGGTRMNLYNIPLELNGWRIAAYFSNPGGGRESYGAVIAVKADPAKATPSPSPTPLPSPTPSAMLEDIMPSPIPVENHEHMFTGAWEYDENGHWQLCACGEKSDIEAHDMQWTLVRAATKDQPGEERGTCSVCGYTGSREVEYTGKGIQLTEGMFKYIIIGIVALIIILVAVKLISDVGRRRRRRRRHGGYKGRH